MTGPGSAATPRGTTDRRRELSLRAIEMRASGATIRAIADALGVSVSYAAELYGDPDGLKRARRRATYEGECVDCGAPTKSSGTSRPSERCVSCGRVHSAETRTLWTRSRVVAAIQWWNAAYGSPPTTLDWNAHDLRERYGDERRARRFEQLNKQGRVPWFISVIARFGTWNDAIRAAGFEPRESGIVANYLAKRKDAS